MDPVYVWTPWIMAFGCASLAVFAWVFPTLLRSPTNHSQRSVRRRQFIASAGFAAGCAVWVGFALTLNPTLHSWTGLVVFILSCLFALTPIMGWISVVLLIVGWARRRSQTGATDS